MARRYGRGPCGERVVAIMTAGSLSVTQTTIARLREAIEEPDASAQTSIMQCGSNPSP